MRSAIAAVIALGLFASPAFASSSQDTMKGCAAQWKYMSVSDRTKTTHQDFMASCMKAGGSSTPAAQGTYGGMGPPTGATAQCKDGTYYSGKSHSGACSHHGGVTKWL